VIFAGEAYVQLPITTDYGAAKLFFSTVDNDIVPTQALPSAKPLIWQLRHLTTAHHSIMPSL